MLLDHIVIDYIIKELGNLRKKGPTTLDGIVKIVMLSNTSNPLDSMEEEEILKLGYISFEQGIEGIEVRFEVVEGNKIQIIGIERFLREE